jgi:DNA polymerase
MSSAYDQLLDATIQHLENLQARGVRHVAVTPQTLQALAQSGPRAPQPAPVAAPPAANRPSPTAESPSTTPKRAAPVATAKPAPASSLQTRDSVASPAAGEVALPLDLPVEVAEAQSAIRNPQSPIEKAAAFASLRERALVCVKCPHLVASRKNVVFGVGSLDAELMFVGEAPGADEDEQAEPFVGKAGQLLTKIIETMGLQRGDVYIANILKCRPDTPPLSPGNRKPTPEEMTTCIPYLHEQIDLVRPRVLVALGGTAMEGLLNKTGITKLRGHWHAYRGIPLMPTYHPSYLLRNQALAEKRHVWEDMLQVMERLGLPINEKQQKFFLRS